VRHQYGEFPIASAELENLLPGTNKGPVDCCGFGFPPAFDSLDDRVRDWVIAKRHLISESIERNIEYVSGWEPSQFQALPGSIKGCRSGYEKRLY
jgi:hypothetical protein